MDPTAHMVFFKSGTAAKRLEFLCHSQLKSYRLPSERLSRHTYLNQNLVLVFFSSSFDQCIVIDFVQNQYLVESSQYMTGTSASKEQ